MTWFGGVSKRTSTIDPSHLARTRCVPNQCRASASSLSSRMHFEHDAHASLGAHSTGWARYTEDVADDLDDVSRALDATLSDLGPHRRGASRPLSGTPSERRRSTRVAWPLQSSGRV